MSQGASLAIFIYPPVMPFCFLMWRLCCALLLCVACLSDYEHFGPRPLYVKVMHQNPQTETFAQCVTGHMKGHRNRRTHFDCLQTAGLQVRYFCGISEFCRRTTRETLAIATANLERNFAAVVVVERMLESFEVLEAALPHLFRGLVKAYRGGGGGGGAGAEVHARANVADKASQGDIAPELKAFVMANPLLTLEYDLYRFAEQRLSDQANVCRVLSLHASAATGAADHTETARGVAVRRRRRLSA